MKSKNTYEGIFKVGIIYLCCFLFSPLLNAQDWRDGLADLIYSPRYFGPNAFPVPEVRNGKVGNRYEIEFRGEYHYYTGDKTTDLFTRAYIPFVKGRVALEVSFLWKEHYKLTPETRDERHAVDLKSPVNYNGDVIVSTIFQVLQSDQWVDILVSANIKTASGGRLVDARFTDAASYWFDANFGRDLVNSIHGDYNYYIRMQAVMGFYCWMTNDTVHRQNDALSYGIGFSGGYGNFALTTNLAGFKGYENNGDRPLILRNNLTYEIKKNIISFRYHHGMKDSLYDTYVLAYIRCF
ncbi:MAG: hypothetical protein LUD02_14790 [Tannerellaceae bacterium]|nr:hypothetical protein [Tannerellaceae bacterium]MCD8265254.1 hypothetical protein [Tannerellaceae bacterium]